MTFLDRLAFIAPGFAVALAVALVGALLSPIVVLRRLAFVGQGVSHAAFGGVGLAAVLGYAGSHASPQRAAIVAAFSIGAGLLVAAMSKRAQRRADTAIGIVMTASMALGFVLYRVAAQRSPTPLPSVEGVLFGDLVAIAWPAAAATAGAAAVIALALAWSRRRVLLWAFDEEACATAGVSADRTALVVMVLLASGVVLATQVAGVVLATAALVLPGATALRLTRSLVPAFAWSVAIALSTVALGVALSVALDWPPGAAIALTQCAAWLAAALGTARRA